MLEQMSFLHIIFIHILYYTFFIMKTLENWKKLLVRFIKSRKTNLKKSANYNAQVSQTLVQIHIPYPDRFVR